MAEKKILIKDICVVVLLFIVSMITFYRIFELSDIVDHTTFALQLDYLKTMSLREFLQNVKYSHILSYPLWHIIYYIMFKLFGFLQGGFEKLSLSYNAIIAAVLLSLCLCFTFKVYEAIFTRYFSSGKRFAFICALAVLFEGPYYFEFGNRYYLGKGIVTTWHNPTTIAVQALAAIVFFLFSYLTEHKEASKKCWVYLSLILVISAVVKPSLWEMIVPGMGIYCGILLLRTKGKDIRFCLKALLAVLPVCMIGLVQSKVSLGGLQGNPGGIGIGLFHVFHIHGVNPIRSILESVVFPLVVCVLLICFHEWNEMMSLTACIVVSGVAQVSFFYLKADPSTGDFFWGFDLAIGIFFLSSLISFVNLCYKKAKRGLWATGVIIFIPHVFWGVWYFLMLFKGTLFLSVSFF